MSVETNLNRWYRGGVSIDHVPHLFSNNEVLEYIRSEPALDQHMMILRVNEVI